jgi:membrane-associated phospholipid phosphatase
LTNNYAPRLACVLLLLVLGELLFLPTLIPLDTAAYNWIEYYRGCESSRLLSAEWPLGTLITLALVVGGYLCFQRRWDEALHGTAIIVIGAFLTEFLKTVFERPRPSVLPSVLVGNSFPSGHTAGAILLAGTLGFWLLRQRVSSLVKVIGLIFLGGFACTVIAQRVYLAHHWLSDVLGTILLAVAWLCVTLSRPVSWRSASPLVLAGGVLLVAYPLFYVVPSLRLYLPSVFSTMQEPLISLSFGETKTPVFLHGAWGDSGQEPIGPITWMHRGEASVEVSLQSRQSYTMRLSVRPFLQDKGFACFPLEVSLNEHLVSRLLLSRGWREYELDLEPPWITPGTNRLIFRTGTDFPTAKLDQEAVAFHRVSVFRKKGSAEWWVASNK